MPKVRDWFDQFATTLIARSNRPNWPAFDSEAGLAFWDDFERSLVRIGATFAHADEASSIVCDMPDLYPADIRPKVIDEVKKIRARSDAESTTNPAFDLDAARLASRDCPDCLGNGSAVRYVHAEIHGKLRTAGGNPVPIGGKVSFPCSCPLGRHVARGMAQPGKQPPLTIDQYPSLRRHATSWGSTAEDGLDSQYAHHPDHWDHLHGCPIPDEGATFTLDKLKALTRKASHFPAEASASRSWSDHATALRNREREPINPVPGRPDLEAVADDPIVARELSPKPKSGPLSIPEDDAVEGWY